MGNDLDGSREGKVKYIRGESGQKIASSFRSGRFEAWKKKERIERMPRVGEREAHNAAGNAPLDSDGSISKRGRRRRLISGEMIIMSVRRELLMQRRSASVSSRTVLARVRLGAWMIWRRRGGRRR